MRDVSEQLDDYQAHIDGLYPPVVAEDVFAHSAESRRPNLEVKVPRRIRAAAFAAAFVMAVALGALAMFLRGPADLDVNEEVALVVPSTAHVSTPVSNTPAAATPTTLVVASTVPATVVSAEDVGGIIELTGDSVGTEVIAAVDGEGRLVVVYWSQEDKTVKLLRCGDVACLEPPEIVVLGSLGTVGPVEDPDEWGPATIDMALLADGTPIAIAENPSVGVATIYTCADSSCARVATAEFVDEGDCIASSPILCSSVGFPQIAVAPDGTPRIAYYHADELRLAVCRDALCRSDSRSTITVDGDLGFGYGRPSIRIGSDGTLLIGHHTEVTHGTTEARVFACTSDSCGPIFEFDDAISPYTVGAGAGGFLVWYRSGPLSPFEGDFDSRAAVERWDLEVAVCEQTSCGAPQSIETDWGLLVAWEVDVRLEPLPDGPVVVAFSYWSPESCGQLLEIKLVDPVSAAVRGSIGAATIGGPFDLVVRDGVATVVFGGEAGGLQLVDFSLSGSGADDSLVAQHCPTP